MLDKWIRCESLACEAISCTGQIFTSWLLHRWPSPSNGVSANRCTPERLSEVGSDRASRCVWPPPLHKTVNAIAHSIASNADRASARPTLLGKAPRRYSRAGALGRKPGDLNDSAESTQFDADGMGATLIEAFPVHRFITRTDDSFQAMAGHFRLPEQRPLPSGGFGGQESALRAADGALGQEKTGEMFRTIPNKMVSFRFAKTT